MFKKTKQKLYNRLFHYDREQYKRKTLSLAEHLSQGTKVIDVGCGSGWFARFLKDHFECHVTGLDVIDYMAGEIDFIKYEGDRIPMEDKSFDVAVCISVIHHTKDPEAVIKELQRVAKKVILIEDYCTTKIGKLGLYLNDYFTNILQNLYKCWCGYHPWAVFSMQWLLKFKTKDQLLHILHKNNMNLISFNRTPISWKGMSHGVYIFE